MLKVTTLPSGLRVATYKINRKAASISATIGVGRRYEQKGQKGLSHYVEHVLNNGTKSYPSSRALRESVEVVGGLKSAGTGDERTTYEVNILGEHLDQGLKTLSEIIQYSLFDPKQAELEKETLRSEIHRLVDSPGAFLGRLVTEALWPNQPLASRKDLEEENFLKLTLADVKKHWQTYYTAPNMVITIVGSVSHNEWVKKVGQAFESLSSKPAPSFPPAKEIAGVVLRTEARDLKQTKLEVAFYGPDRRDPQRFVVRILRSILGKRLFYKLREDLNLSYSPFSDYTTFEDTGFLEFGSSFVPGRINDVTTAIFDEISELKESGIQPNELEFAKARIKSGIILHNESLFALAASYSTRVFNNTKPLLLEDEVEIIEQINEKEVLTAAKKYLTENYKIAAIGPEKDIRELEKLYGKKQAE